MTKFSGTKRRPLHANLTAPIRTLHRRARTYEGGAAVVRDAESEVFLLAATNMIGEDTSVILADVAGWLTGVGTLLAVVVALFGPVIYRL